MLPLGEFGVVAGAAVLVHVFLLLLPVVDLSSRVRVGGARCSCPYPVAADNGPVGGTASLLQRCGATAGVLRFGKNDMSWFALPFHDMKSR